MSNAPRRPRKRRSDEHRIQAALLKWARYASVQYPGLRLMFAIPNGGARDKLTGAMLKAEGVKPGVPDIFLPFPIGPYHGLFIELKTVTGRLSSEQRDWLQRLQHQGYAAVVCRGLDEAFDTIKYYMTGQLEAAPIEGRLGAASIEGQAPTPRCGYPTQFKRKRK